MRTLYDGISFQEIREGETFRDGSLTTRYGSEGNTNLGTEGSRYRWIGEETSSAETRTRRGGEYGEVSARWTGTSVTLYGRGEAVAVSASAGTRGGAVYLGKDILGSVRSSTNEYGTLEDRYEYDAFGVPYQGDLTQGMNLGYTGKAYDVTTGLYNYGYRDYAPTVARFTTVDPVRDGVNWFTYVNNDPVNYVDLWGLIDWDLVGKGIYNTVVGTGKVVGGAALIKVSVAGTVATGGTLSPLGVGGVILGSGAVANGWVQVSIGIAELLSGLVTDPQVNRPEIPSTLNQVVGIIGDDIVESVTGENSTVIQEGAKVIDEIQTTVIPRGLGIAVSLTAANIKLH
jgi:RHS repeat-associated protein